MSFAFVNKSGVINGDNATSIAATYSGTAGNLLVYLFGSGNGSGDPLATQVQDNLGVNWTIRASDAQNDGAGGNFRAVIAYRIGIPSGITSVTASGMPSGTYSMGGVLEFSYGTTPTEDQYGHPGGTNPLSTGNITNSTTTGLVVVIGSSNDGVNNAWGGNSGWLTGQEEPDSNSHTVFKSLYRIETASAGPFSALMNYPNAAANSNTAVILSFMEGSVSSFPPAPESPLRNLQMNVLQAR